MSMPIPSGLSSSSDNYATFMSALSNGGFSLPEGVFPCSRALTPTIAATIESPYGSYRSIIEITTPAQPAISLVNAQRINILGIGLTGAGIGSSTAPGISISRKGAPNTYGLNFEDLAIQGFGGNSVDAPEGNLIVSSLVHVVSTDCGGGPSLTGVPGGAAGTSVSLSQCFSVGCKNQGFTLNKMCYSSVDTCACDSCGAGYILTQCEGISIRSSGAESILATGITMYDDGTAFRVDGCKDVDISACYNYANSHLVAHVSGGSDRVRIQVAENSPLATATGYMMVDSGSRVI